MNKYRQEARQLRRKLARQLRQGQNTLRIKGCHVHGIMTGMGGSNIGSLDQRLTNERR